MSNVEGGRLLNRERQEQGRLTVLPTKGNLPRLWFGWDAGLQVDRSRHERRDHSVPDANARTHAKGNQSVIV